MAIRVGINGFGRIGRITFRALTERYGDSIEVVAVNDLSDPKTNAHLLKHDSNYGLFSKSVEVQEDGFVVDGEKVRVFAQRNPADIPWGDVGVDFVVESTGFFTDATKAAAHIQGGAKKVIISAPAKNEDATFVMGVNNELYDPSKHHVVSNASCTTNCLAPIAKVILDNFGIESGFMTTCHAYTNDQRIADQVHEDLRRARAAAQSIIPSSTGAAKALSLVIPELKGKLNGTSLRVPTPVVSIVDLVVNTSKSTTVEEVNAAFKAAEQGAMAGFLGLETEELVSIDFKRDPRSSIVDGPSTMMLGDKMLKVFSWYDNEWGYSNRVADLINFMASKGL
ncbi:glyceraldehyde-3-phosphate dehydrogenase (NAD+) [Abditibacterium utsteinense]|uniref:Glyceraldehyde-3-phosphate dehydrogenase n=1 Tax=Abditibacterium utsteinense TaxID=1960156 RepID=A0A2S8SQP2_9BACT|nr:type I glyceraldehyde-3-phosphate dehydrogenase [Abditibacterium utsteinense]PQV63110.1 glyceraldehyde-3-phosphate dehydrogenase (NAD+) [Abditibacterium utsteinense]